MLIELLAFILFGLLAGTLTGLIPGLHINMISAVVISITISILAKINPVFIVAFIVSMSITHTFVDFIPSVLLGCPDSDTELSILPGHELLKQGHGYQAIMLTLYGSVAAIILLVIFSFPIGLIIKKFYNSFSSFIPFILITLIIILIYLERKKLNAIFVIILSGILGTIVLNYQGLNQPFLPLLSGLFGASNLILSIKNKTKIPEQKISKPKINFKSLFKPLFGSLIASPICTVLPGLGAGQASIIGHVISNQKEDKKSFLILLGATNTLVMGFSFITLYLLSRTRTGSAIAVQQLIGEINFNMIILIISIIIISGILSFFLAKFLAKIFSIRIQKINYTKISIATLIFIAILTILVSGFLGFSILIISTLTGIYCISLGVRRTNMMGCLIIPTILFYLGIVV